MYFLFWSFCFQLSPAKQQVTVWSQQIDDNTYNAETRENSNRKCEFCFFSSEFTEEKISSRYISFYSPFIFYCLWPSNKSQSEAKKKKIIIHTVLWSEKISLENVNFASFPMTLWKEKNSGRCISFYGPFIFNCLWPSNKSQPEANI